jgi:hypothetical protein
MSLQTRISDLITAIGTDYKQLRTWITGSGSGDLTGLTTADKTSIVAAVNEVRAAAASATVPDATTAAPGKIEIATNEILGVGVPAALDTLDELAAALGDDANFGATITTSLANRLRVDTAAQGLTATQKTNGQTNLDVYSKGDFGNPDTDLVALYTTAKA